MYADLLERCASSSLKMVNDHFEELAGSEIACFSEFCIVCLKTLFEITEICDHYFGMCANSLIRTIDVPCEKTLLQMPQITNQTRLQVTRLLQYKCVY